MDNRHYRKTGPVARRLNGVVGWLARRGISLYGAQDLAVRGRKTGTWRRVPVNPLSSAGELYLVSVRGEAEWVRNLRAAGGGRLRVGRRTRAFTAVELPDDDKPDLLRSYLRRWGFEVKPHFGGVTADSPGEELRRIAPDHPVFRITVGE